MLYLGDNKDLLPLLRPCSVDSVITDPPAGINFMSKTWDRDKGGRDQWVAWLQGIMELVLTAAKPGASALVWALPRTSHWTGWAIEGAGWVLRDRITHCFGSGFPKSADISKAIDKAAGAEREKKKWRARASTSGTMCGSSDSRPWIEESRKVGYHEVAGNEPVTDGAKLWAGHGTALKPAAEDWWLAMKPLDGTFAENALKHGVAGLNVEGCRIGTATIQTGNGAMGKNTYGNMERKPETASTSTGRWPANLALSHHPDCVRKGVKKVKAIKGGNSKNVGNAVYGLYKAEKDGEPCGYSDADGNETVEAWECVDGCPVKLLDEQSGETGGGRASGYDTRPNLDTRGGVGAISFRGGGIKSGVHFGDSGGASRFFYCAKSSKREREQMNKHPTVKPLAFMRWLCRLTRTPTGGVVLDPFLGSGTTMIAAFKEKRFCIGIEQSEEYAAIAAKRMQNVIRKAGFNL